MKGENYYKTMKVMIFVIDFWLLHLAFRATRSLGFVSTSSDDQSTLFFLIFSLVWIIAGLFMKIYRIETTSLVQTVSISLLSAFIIHILVIGTLLTVFHVYEIQPRLIIAQYILSALFIAGFRILYKLITKYYQFSGFDQRKVIVVGATSSGIALYNYFSASEFSGYEFKGFFDEQEHKKSSFQNQVIGTLDSKLIKNYCQREGIGEIYFALPFTYNDLLRDLSKYADDNFIYMRIAPDFSKVIHDNHNVYLMNSVPVLTSRKEPLGNSFNASLKRVFDFIFSLTVILTIFPIIFPIIALAIRLNSRGPIFFKQLRPGKKNKLFDCYKFRTMSVNSTSELQATKNDSRITSVGRILRKTNLDELPQFFNVLLGNMSVVGPRPNMISQLEEYSKTIRDYRMRHFVTPGITGYAQVNGFRGETKEAGLMEKRVAYDVKYIETWSLGLDIKIIFKTVFNMVRGEKSAY